MAVVGFCGDVDDDFQIDDFISFLTPLPDDAQAITFWALSSSSELTSCSLVLSKTP